MSGEHAAETGLSRLRRARQPGGTERNESASRVSTCRLVPHLIEETGHSGIVRELPSGMTALELVAEADD